MNALFIPSRPPPKTHTSTLWHPCKLGAYAAAAPSPTGAGASLRRRDPPAKWAMRQRGRTGWGSRRGAAAALAAAALLALGGGARGAVTMPSTFGDGLVLQTNNEYGTRGFLNGFASPGERVTISGSGSYEVTADADGAWSVMINPHSSSSAPSMTLTVQGETGPPAIAKGCMFGDVFVCGGGSTMLAPLSGAANASAEIATAADYPLMRLFVAAPATAASPARNVSGRWVPLTPASAAQFSALCYLTARQIGVRGNEHPTEFDKTKRPMGLVLAAADGAPLASWAPTTPGPTHFNGMIAPLKYLSVRAALFSHGAGAGTHGDAAAYGGQLAAVVQGWRALMPIGDFGFNIVQLGQVPASSGLSAADADAVRLAQTNALPQAKNGTCGVGVAVSYDLAANDASAIGDRLALATLHSTYAAQCGGDENRTDCDAGAGEVCWWGGPQPVSASHVAGETMVKLLPCSAVGLTAVGDHPAGFEVSFSGSEWTAIPPAGVTLERTSITLSVPGGKAPNAVRFVVSRGAGGALTNAAGIAIAPFELQLAPSSPLTQPDGGSSEASTASKAAPGTIPLSPPMGYNSWNYCATHPLRVQSCARTAQRCSGPCPQTTATLTRRKCWRSPTHSRRSASRPPATSSYHRPTLCLPCHLSDHSLVD